MKKIRTLSIDIETYSDMDLQKCGVYKYAQSPAFEILLFGVSVNGGEVMVYDLAQGEEIPMEIIQVLTDDMVTKWAFNASFERVCLSEYLRRNYPQQFYGYSINEDTVGDYLDPAAWKCSMIWSAYMGASAFTCRGRCSAWFGRTEAEGRQRPYSVFLCSV